MNEQTKHQEAAGVSQSRSSKLLDGDNAMQEPIGQITVGVGTPQERKIDVIDMLQSPRMIGDRIVTITQLIDGAFTFEVTSNIDNNPVKQHMWLSEDSMIVLLAFLTTFVHQKIGIEQIQTRLNYLLGVEKRDSEIEIIATKDFINMINQAV